MAKKTYTIEDRRPKTSANIVSFYRTFERLYLCGMDAQTLHIDFIVPQGWHELTNVRCPWVIL